MKRVLKKICTPFDNLSPTAAILVVNLFDPQVNTMKVFLEAVNEVGIPYFIVGNKCDLNNDATIVKKAFGQDVILTSMKNGSGLDLVKDEIKERFKPGSRIIVLGVFNSGKTSLISSLTGHELEVSDMPGSTSEFAEHEYQSHVLIDTVGQVIDINKPLMVSIDLSGCNTVEEKISRVLREDANAVLATLEVAVPSIKRVIGVIKERVSSGGKVIVTGAGASALVAMEMAGQGVETGLPIMVFTNNLSGAQPVSFAKGLAEEEGGLARYIALSVNKDDVVIGVSASGGTGFIYDALRRARVKGAVTVAITENPDTPLGKSADYIIKSNAKPEGPSSSKIQVAHLAIGHALILGLSDERGVTAEESVKFMISEAVPTKKMGLK
jgi:D-arabinose 5-phosphate isomerase GutQ